MLTLLTLDSRLQHVYVPILEAEQYYSCNVALAAQQQQVNYQKSTSIPFASDTNKRSDVNKEDTAIDDNEDNNSNIVVDDEHIAHDLRDCWQPMGDNDDNDDDTQNQDLLGNKIP